MLTHNDGLSGIPQRCICHLGGRRRRGGEVGGERQRGSVPQRVQVDQGIAAGVRQALDVGVGLLVQGLGRARRELL